MPPKQGHVQTVAADSLKVKSVILLFCATICIQNIHASTNCNSMSDSGSVCVTITNPPRANVSDNEHMNLRCTWDRDNFDFLMWTLNDSSSLPSGHQSYFDSARTLNTLAFPGTPQGHGEYRCVVVRRDRPSLREFAPLFIFYFPRIVFVEPINRNSPTFKTVRFGSPFSYSCTPTNQDRKLWTDRYKTPIQSSSDGRIVVTTGHTDNITINQATFEDAKEYYCYAFVYSLDESSPVIQERHLFRPVIIEGRPTIHCHQSSKAVEPGSLVSFVCTVRAYPEPDSISWSGRVERTDMSRVEIPNRYHSFRTIVDAWNSTLSFKNYVEVNDSGTYSVTARNKFGEASETVTLQVIHIPDALTEVEVTALNATGVRVSWTEPENKDALNLLYYKVLYGRVDSERVQVNVSANKLQVELNLLPVTEYYFTVGAVNGRGTGDLSSEAKITTDRSVPVAPVSVTVDMSTVTPESALVTWTPLTDEYTGGFNLVRYIVSYKQDNDEESVATRLEVEPEASQIVLEGLEPLATYTASVQGVNALGEGFPAVSQAFTTPELSIPGSPINVAPQSPSDAGLYVCWTPGPNSYHIQSYQVTVYQHQNGTDVYKAVFLAAESVDTQQLQRCAKVSGLQADSCYWFRVAAENTLGSSNASDISGSPGCTISGLSGGLGAILREPQVLAPVIIAAVVVAVLVVLCGLGCLVRRRSRKKERGLYEVTNFSEKKPIHQLSADGPDSFQVANTAFSPDGTIGRGANQPSPAQLNGPGGLRVHPTGPSGTGEWSLTSITPDSGIPSLPVWDEMQLGPAARYNPPQGSLMDNSNESEQPVQWTLGPAHESRDTPPIVDRAVSVDHTDSGVDYGEELSHFDSQVSTTGQCDSEMDFEYTDNVAYRKVARSQAVGGWDGSVGGEKQPLGGTAVGTGLPQRPSEVTLQQVPNCRDKELVIFKQPPREPTRFQASTNSLQTSL